MNKNNALFAEVEIEVEFHDLDPMGVAWHGNYLRYFERARCALLRKFDYDYPAMRASGYLWPIVDCRLRYVAPARYGQRLRVRAELAEWESRLAIEYLVLDAASGARLTEGRTVQVAVTAEGWELQLVAPKILLEKLERAWRN
jgi:acyl-CoA thioester hydrolase